MTENVKRYLDAIECKNQSGFPDWLMAFLTRLGFTEEERTEVEAFQNNEKYDETAE